MPKIKTATAATEAAATDIALPKIAVTIAPPKSGGDAVELAQFEGDMVALFCRDRDDKKTRFGQRRMTSVYIATLDSNEPLAGIMFQSYFQDLELGQWYIGIVTRVKSGNNLQWILSTDGLNRNDVQNLARHLETIRVDDDARRGLLD
jgi:hypothetical protein